MTYEESIAQGGVDVTPQFKPPTYEDVLKQGGIDVTPEFKTPTYEDTIKEGGVDVTDKFMISPAIKTSQEKIERPTISVIKEVAKTIPFVALRGLEAVTSPITAPLETMGIDTRKMLQESAEYWRPELGGIPNYVIDIDEKWRPSIKRAGEYPISEVVGGTAGAAGFVLGPGMAGMTAGRLVTSLPAIEKAARPFYRDILTGMIGGALTGEGKVDETLQNAALFGMFSAIPHLKDVPQTIKDSNIWRRATIKERGLVLQSLEDTIKRNPDMSEAEILRTWNNPAWFQQALSRRAEPEPIKPKPAILKPKPEIIKPVEPVIKGQEVPLEMVPKELVKPEVKAIVPPKSEVAKPEVKPEEIPPTAQHLELMPEEYSKIEAVAVKQDGKIYRDHAHAKIMVENNLDPEKAIPGFVTKEGKFVEQYPEAKVEGVKPSIEPLTEEKVSPEALPVSEKGVEKSISIPEGWTTEVAPTFRRTPGWQSEVDWKNKRIVFETAEDAKNVDIKNHEIAHIRIEDSLGYIEKLSDSPFLSLYAKVRGEAKDTHINFIREHLAMDYGEYLTNPEKVGTVLKNLFKKYLPEEIPEKPLTKTIPPSEWKKDPVLVAVADVIVKRINNEYPGAEKLLPEDLEYQAVQKFEDSGMHMWNVNKPGHPKNKSAVYGPIFKLAPKVEKVQPELFEKPGPETEMASVGTYDIGGGGAPAERPKEPIGRMVNIIDMPEMVELYNELTQGKYPKIKKILRAFRGQATGTYRPGTEKIDLRADIFKDPAQAKAVLAHEIGHLIDDLPEHILKQRGNILGRIASLKNYLKKYLEEYEGAPGPLTNVDKTRLMKDAREALKLEKAKAEKQADAFKDMKLTSEDIKAIWNDVEARNKNKPVYDFIVSLSEVEKNQIVREAMRGIVSEANQRRFRISMPIEGRPFKDWDQRLRDIFNKLVKEELEKRRVFTYDNIMGELKNLSVTWKPFTPIPGTKFTKYRFSPQELYADAMSVLFNNPGLLADKSPNFYKGFFNYIHRKPEVKRVFDDIQARIGMGEEAILGHRREQVKAMFIRGEETLAELRKPEPYNIIEVLRTAFISRREGLLKLKREAQKRGVKLDPEKDPDYWTEELPYISSPIFDMVRDINNTILKPAQSKGISQSDIGEYLLYRREATERAKMANPKGYTEADALKQMDFLKKQIGDERFNYLTDLVKKSWEIREKDIFPVLEKARVFYPETMDLIKSNEVYTPFQVREHLEQKYGPNVTAKIYRQIGTLKEVINPLTAGVIKDMSLVRMAERKMIAESVVTFLKENFPEQITPAETRWTGKYHDIIDPTDPKLGLIGYTQDGKVTGYYVPKSIANIFSKDPYDFQPILRLLSVIQKPFKEILVSKNPGWWVWNIQRDLKALAKQVPGMDIPRAIKYSVKSLGDAYKDIFKDVSTEDVKAMYQMKALGVGRYWSASELGPESHLDKIVQSFGETPAKYDLEVLGPYKLIWDYLKAGSILLDKFGAVGERIPKIAAYKFLKENTSLPDKMISHLIRKRAGSPDFWGKGGLDFLYNNLFWFSNAGKEGIRAALEAARENPRAYIWKTTKYDILPKLLMLAGGVGLLGKTIKDLMDNIPERDKGNYLTVPVGVTSDNKTVYFVMPHDFQGQVVGGMLWKALRLGKAGNIGGIIDYMAGGLPYTGINPLLGLATDWQQYITGKNPYDPLRGKYVIPETMFEAGGKKAIEEMLKYSSNQLGGGIVYRFKGRNVEEVKSELEKVLGLPVVGNFLNRFIRVSDAGRADELRHVSEVVRTERARELIRIDDALGKWVSENYPKIIETPKDIYDQMVKDKSIQRHTYKEFLERLQEIVGYRLGSPEYEAISRARSTEEKATLILKIMEKGKRKEEK